MKTYKDIPPVLKRQYLQAVAELKKMYKASQSAYALEIYKLEDSFIQAFEESIKNDYGNVALQLLKNEARRL